MKDSTKFTIEYCVKSEYNVFRVLKNGVIAVEGAIGQSPGLAGPD